MKLYLYFVGFVLGGGTVFFHGGLPVSAGGSSAFIKQACRPCWECCKYLCGAAAGARRRWGGLLCWAACTKFNRASDVKASTAQIWKCTYPFFFFVTVSFSSVTQEKSPPSSLDYRVKNTLSAARFYGVYLLELRMLLDLARLSGLADAFVNV